MSFEKLNILPALIKEVKSKGYFHPTPFQIEAIPHILAQKDILGVVKAGAGKTDTISIPILQQIIKRDKTYKTDRKIRALVIVPNKKKAIRSDKSFYAYGGRSGVKSVAVFEEDDRNKKKKVLNSGINVLIGTSKRIVELLNAKAIDLSGIKFLVIDDVNVMILKKQEPNIRKILAVIPAQRQTMMFTDKMRPDIQGLLKDALKDPVTVQVSTPKVEAKNISQSLYYTDRKNKENVLLHILEKSNTNKTIIYARTKKGVSIVIDALKAKGIEALDISDGRTKDEIAANIDKFHKENKSILVTTDMASRGLKIDGIEHVISFDLTKLSISYLHRLSYLSENGNTSSIAESEENHFVKVLEKIDGIKFAQIKDHPFPQLQKPDDRRKKDSRGDDRGRGRDRGGKSNKKGKGGGKSRYPKDRGSTELPEGLKKKMMWPLG